MLVAFGVTVGRQESVGIVSHCCCDGQSEHFGKEEGEDETSPSPDESFDTGDGMGLIDGIIGRVARPAGREAEHAGCETQHAACLAVADLHGKIDESARMGELAKDDEEDDERRDPAVEFVVMNHFVAEKGNDESCSGDDDDACDSRKIIIYGVEELRANYNVNRRPPNACEDVEDGNDFHAVPAKVESGEHHLA